MQVLYLLKTEDWTLSRMRTLGTDGLSNAAFSPDSRFLILGLFCHLGSDIELYDSRGRLLCLFKDLGGHLPSHAFLGNDRLALAMSFTFEVYDIWSGQLQASKGPYMGNPVATWYEVNHEPLIALNRSCTMLAFCVIKGSILGIYDAATFQELRSNVPGAALHLLCWRQASSSQHQSHRAAVGAIWLDHIPEAICAQRRCLKACASLEASPGD